MQTTTIMMQRLINLFRLIIFIGIMIGLYWGWTLLKDPNNFPIAQIKVEATFQHVTPSTLRATIQPYVTRGFFNLNVSQLQQQLEQLPWVANADIERIWPNTIRIKITEQTAVAQWNQNELINPMGNVFPALTTTIPQDLPLLSGPNDQENVAWQYYSQMQQRLAPLNLTINRFSINSRQSIQLNLNNGITLRLGKDDIIPRLQRFITVYPQLLAPQANKIKSVDLRYDNGLAVNWRNNIKNFS